MSNAPSDAFTSIQSINKTAHDVVWRLGELASQPWSTTKEELLNLGHQLSTLAPNIKTGSDLQDDQQRPDAANLIKETLNKIKEALMYLESFSTELYERIQIEKVKFLQALRDTFQYVLNMENQENLLPQPQEA